MELSQPRILEWVAISSSRESSQPRDHTRVSFRFSLGRWIPYHRASREAQKITSEISHSVMSDSLQPCGLQHARPPCPSPTPRIYSNSCPLSRWCHPTISSSFIPFSSRFQSFPASGSFQMSQFFASGGQSIGVSASTSVLPMSIQDWSPLGRTGWISLQSKGLSRGFSNTYTSVKWQMATSHRSPYCPKIVKLVHVKPPNAQKLKFVFICWNACLTPAKRAPQRRATSLCAHCHPMTMLAGTTAFFFLLLLGLFTECLPLLWKVGSMRGDLTGLLHGSIPSP